MRNINRGQSTGLPGLDRILKGILPGDNIVWQVSNIEDYIPFVEAFCKHAIKSGRKVVYFRFAQHRPVVEEGKNIEIHEVNCQKGFEPFIEVIHKEIEKTGNQGFYVFDCFSEVEADWLSDRALGNIFMLTCPYIYDLEAMGYFALLRNQHSFHATAPIAETTQVLIDVYRHNGNLYIHPIKTTQRFSSTIHMLHAMEKDDFVPVAESTTISEILTSAPWSRLESSSFRLGPWSSAFLKAEEVLHAMERGEYEKEKADELFYRLLRMVFSHDKRILELAERFLNLSDILNIRMRMIGTGLIGGKAVGILLANSILRQNGYRWNKLLEPYDLFFIGSDVFYTFLVQNGVWWVRRKQRNPATYLEGAEEARRRILTGTFPEYINKQFEDMLDYFGQSPIIVRSSSILEDNFGNSLAGKNKSIFCANQGPRHERLEDFLSAVRNIYASSMSKEALIYRARRGILEQEEQMAILVQRVSGVIDANMFFPHISGVGFSFNPYVWSEDIDPKAGIIRLVFGLGTRAVDRSDDDYTRIVALNAPERRPETNFDEVREYSQHKVDILDLEANRLVTRHFVDIARQSKKLPFDLFASRDEELERLALERNQQDVFPYVLTFEKLLKKTPFVTDMAEMLKTLQDAYNYPVDMEFTANFDKEQKCKINIVQCRPLQVKGGGKITDPPPDLCKEDLIFKSHGAVIGQSRVIPVDRFIYISPDIYGKLPINDRITIARLVGKITHLNEPGLPKSVMLIGPGRWGTTTPSLGVPIVFSDISPVSVLCEIVTMNENLVPDVSLGTHFFNELVETDILYVAIFPDQQNTLINQKFFEKSSNKLPLLLPDSSRWSDTIKVIDVSDLPMKTNVKINANALKQAVVCYFDKDESDKIN